MTRMRIRKWTRRACFGSAATFAAVGLFGPAAFARGEPNPPETHPPEFAGAATATAVQAELNTDPPQTVEEILHPSIPRATSEFRSGGTSSALASQFDPG